MARKPMVTRSFDTMQMVVTVANIETATLSDMTINSATFTEDNHKQLKIAKEMLETDTIKVVTVKSALLVERLLGMSEQDFINNAVVLDPLTRQPLESEDK